jgi:peptidoglycan/LPS O-acetylase OafA/YrhL
MHAIVLDFFPNFRPALLDTLVVTSLVIAISTITYTFIEIPFIALSKKLAVFDRTNRKSNPSEEPASSFPLSIRSRRAVPKTIEIQ